MPRLFLDIETIGSDDPAVAKELEATITPPRTMTRAETIEKWKVEDRPALVAEAVKKTAFDGAWGRIICVGYAIDEGPVRTKHEGIEKQILVDLFHATSHLDGAQVVGHNVTWDIRFLWQRAVINQVPRPRWLRSAVKAKPWEIEDTMLLWNPDRERRTSLDKLCKALGVPTPKGDLDGAKVADYFKAGRIEEIAAYCAADVSAMRECHARMA